MIALNLVDHVLGAIFSTQKKQKKENLKEVLSHPKWELEMEMEMTTFEKNQSWEISFPLSLYICLFF